MEMCSETLSSIFHHICKSDSIVMQSQLYLCDKRPLKFIDKYSHHWLLEWVAFGHSTVDIFTPTPLFSRFFPVYSVMPVSQLLCEWAGAKKKRERELVGGGGLAIATFTIISPHRIILCDDINLI